MTHEQLLREMENILETKGEKALEGFILEHFSQLPEDVQRKALFGFFSEALEKEVAEAKIQQLQRMGIDTMAALQALKGEASRKA